MRKKPGVMIYFELQPLLERLSDAEAGLLFRAILEYGATGNVPILQDNLYILWPLIQMRLNTDDDRYRMIGQKRRYACYVRWTKHHGQEPMPFNDWLSDPDFCEEDELT